MSNQRNKAKENNCTKNALMLYDELVSIYKKEYCQTFKNEDKHDYKNLKDLDYQPDQLQPDELVLPKWVKVAKNRFDEIQSIVTEAKNNRLKTSVGKNIITVNSIEELIKDVASKKNKSKRETKNRYNAILDDSISKIVGFKNLQKIKVKY